MGLTFFLLGFFIFVTMAFLVIAFIFPEWVGITGQKAKDIQKHQQGLDDPKSDDIKSNLF